MKAVTIKPKKSDQMSIKYPDGFRQRLELAADFNRRKVADFARGAVERAVEQFEKEHPEVLAKAQDLWKAMERKAA